MPRVLLAVIALSLFYSKRGLAEASFFLDSYEQKLQQKAQGINLAQSRSWRKLLFISDSNLFESRSIVDDPEFFLADEGSHNPKAELEASIKALIQPGEIVIKDQLKTHPRCVFVARWRFLKEKLAIDESKIHPVTCEKYKEYKQLAKYTGVSLVFSSYFINSPASMFGHTFLRLHRDQPGQINNGLLDDAANFSASVQRYNALTYPFKGLFGMFPGQFSLMPYFQKIQEYNNYESRDLWEYQLNFSDKEIDFLTDILYEIGHFRIDYYYFDDNCSFILNLTLEAAKPDLKVTEGFRFYAIPVDTLKSVTSTKGLVTNIQYRPSAFSRFKQRVEELTEAQQELFKSILQEQSLQSLQTNNGCESQCQAQVLDATVDFIDFKEKLSGMRESEQYGPLRRLILGERSKLKVLPQPVDETPQSEQPDSGHWASALAVKSGWTTTDSFASFLQWKPALQDFDAHPQGYGQQMLLSFFDTQLAYIENFNQVYLERLRLMDLTSAPTSLPGYRPWSWHFSLGGEVLREDWRQADRITRYYIEAGSGLTTEFAGGRGRLFVMAHANMGFSPHRRGQWYLSPAVQLGLRYQLAHRFQAYLESRYDYMIGRENWNFWESRLRFTYFSSTNSEVFVEANYRTNALINLLGLRYYY